MCLQFKKSDNTAGNIMEKQSPWPLPTLQSRFRLPVCSSLQFVFLYYNLISFPIPFITFSGIIVLFFHFLNSPCMYHFIHPKFINRNKNLFSMLLNSGHPNSFFFFFRVGIFFYKFLSFRPPPLFFSNQGSFLFVCLFLGLLHNCQLSSWDLPSHQPRHSFCLSPLLNFLFLQ